MSGSFSMARRACRVAQATSLAMLTAQATLPASAFAADETPAPAAAVRRAPSPAESQAFLAGTQALAAGDADGALKAFQDGFAIAQDPAFLVKVGEAHEKKNDAKAAAAAYRRYVTLVPDASDADEIRARAERLDPTIASPAPGGTAPAAATPTGTAAAPAPTLPRAQMIDLGEIRPEITEDEEPRSALNIAAWIGAGTTTVLLGVAGFYGARAGSKKDDVNRLQFFTNPDGSPLEYASVRAEFEAAQSEGKRDDKIAKAFLWSAAATGVATVALFVVDALRTPETPVVKRSAAADRGWQLSFRPVAAPSAGSGGGLGVGIGVGMMAGLEVPLK